MSANTQQQGGGWPSKQTNMPSGGDRWNNPPKSK